MDDKRIPSVQETIMASHEEVLAELQGLRSALQVLADKEVPAPQVTVEASEPPVVNVPAPIVNLPDPEPTEILSKLDKVISAIEGSRQASQVNSGPSTVSLSPEDRLLLAEIQAEVSKLNLPTKEGGTGKGSGSPLWVRGGGGSLVGAVSTAAPTYADGTTQKLSLTTDGKLRTDATISAGDIEIGAVEIKNSTTDDRTAVINLAPTTEFGLVVRNIPSGTQDENIKQVNGVTVNVGTGAAGTGTQRVAVSSDSFPASQAVTGTVAVSNLPATQPVSAAALPLPSGAATSALQTQPGVDIGDVTVNNASGGSAVNIQDGGNSITVDGTVTITPSGTQTVKETWGTTSYVSSTLTSGTLSATGTLRALRVFASAADGTFNVNGGNTITVRSGTGFDWNPTTTLTNPVINWVSGTLDCFIEYV